MIAENKKKIIIVDDVELVITGLKSVLRNFEILKTCRTSQEFFSIYKQYEAENNPNADISEKVDIILIDIRFENWSELNGFEILERLTKEDYNAIKVIITGKPIDFEDILKAKGLGANGFVSKNALDKLSDFLETLKIDEFKVEDTTAIEATNLFVADFDFTQYKKFIRMKND